MLTKFTMAVAVIAATAHAHGYDETDATLAIEIARLKKKTQDYLD